MSRSTLPPVSDAFAWRDTPWGPVLECGAFAAIAPHGFTTRTLDPSSPAGLEALAALTGSVRTATVTQVHGRDVAVVRAGDAVWPARPEADAMVSNARDVAVAVRAADCAPILIADRATGAVAAVHAGWRGTAAGVAVATVHTLTREFGSRPEDLMAAIGPTIGACCYEVGPELVDAFAAAGHDRSRIDRWFTSLPPPRGSRARAPLHLDVPGANRDQLVLAGVPEERVHVSGLCTAMHLDVLTSYRAEKERAGRLAGVIRAAGR